MFVIEKVGRLVCVICKEMLRELFKKYKVIFEERRVCELGKWEV